MKRTHKRTARIMSAVLAIIMLVSMIPAAGAAVTDSPVAANAETSVGTTNWSYSNGTLTISGTGPMEEYNDKPWKNYNSSIKSVIVKSGITSISDGAFSNLTNLESVSLPNTIESIGSLAFFFDWKLTSITIPDSVKSIRERAFWWCDSLRTINIGSNLRVIDKNPFGYSGVETINLSSKNSNFVLKDGVLFDDEGGLVCYPPYRYDYQTKGKYTVPGGTTKIYPQAFEGCESSTTSVVVPGSVKEIGEGAFEYSHIQDITINSGVLEIGNRAFNNSFNLLTVSIPDTVTCIGTSAFHFCKTLETINVSAYNKNYKSENGILFGDKGKTLIQYPVQKTNTSYTVPSNVTAITDEAFRYNNYLKTIKLPAGLTEIGTRAFGDCENLSGEIVIPDGVTEIGTYAFAKDKNITKVVLGNQIKSVSYATFENCDSLKQVYFKGNKPYIMGENYYLTNATFYYPYGDETWAPYAQNSRYKTWNTPVIPVVDIPITNSTFTLSETVYTYNGHVKKPSVNVVYKNKTLTEGVDYKLTYLNNINAGTASVRVDGIGRYVGSKTLNFSIGKDDQTLSASVAENEIKVGQKTQITATGIGTIDYFNWGDDAEIASVDSKGVITGKKEGTALIYVSASGNNNYRDSIKSIRIKVTKAPPKLTIDNVSYSFSNSSSGFHYPSGYETPLSSYKIIFSEPIASYYYNRNLGQGWHGNCYGMSASAMMFNVSNSWLKLNMFNTSATKVKDLKYNNYSSSLGFNITTLCEAMLQIQNVDFVATVEKQHRRDMAGLINEVKKCDNGGAAVMIGFNGPRGHEVLGYRYEKVNSTQDRVHIYDCNYPLTDKYITFEKNSSGNYTNWYYNDYKQSTHDIDWSNYSLISEAWDTRNSAKKSTMSDSKMVVKSSNNFAVRDNRGNQLAEMKNGQFISNNEHIFEVIGKDTEIDGHLIYLPKNLYTIVNNENTDKKIEVTMVDSEQSVSVTTESDTVKLFVDDNQAANIANVDGDGGEKYEVSLNSDLEYASNVKNVVYSGKASEKELSVGTSYGDLVASNYTRTGVQVNNEIISFSRDSDLAISDCTAKLSGTSFNYTGTSIEPQVTVTDSNNNTLTEGVDYTVVYAGSNTAGTATAIVYGINKYKGCKELNYTINALDLSKYTAEISQTSFTYDGTQKKPVVVVKNGSQILTENLDYSLQYQNNQNVGTAKAIIKGINGYKGSITKSFTITDSNAPSPTSVKLNRDTLGLGIGENYGLVKTIAPSNANQNVTWSSSNSSVATVDSNGKVVGKGSGTATVAVKTSNGKTATCKVTVKPAPTSVKTNPASLTLGVGESYTISESTSSGSYANAANLSWASTNTKVVTVSKTAGTNKAVLKATGTGTANVTIKTYNGKTATCKVTVKPAPASVKTNPASLTLGKGESYTISESTDSGSYANAANLSWSSSNTKVATVTKGSANKATVKAVGTGTANITIKLYNGKTATCKVTVKPAPTSVKTNPTTLTLNKGKTYTISESTNSGSYANAANLKWTSTNTKVATVTKGSANKAKVKAVAKGTAYIKIALYNGKTAQCKVTVK